MPATADDAPVEQLLDELVAAWNHGDARAYAERYRPDGTFTNVNGGLYVGRDEFARRHEEIFAGYLEGTTLRLAISQLRFVRPDVAVVDVDISLFGITAPPAGVPTDRNGAMHTRLLMVLVRRAAVGGSVPTTMSGARQGVELPRGDTQHRAGS